MGLSLKYHELYNRKRLFMLENFSSEFGRVIIKYDVKFEYLF